MNEDYLDLCKVLYVLKSNQVQATFYINLILEWILEPNFRVLLITGHYYLYSFYTTQAGFGRRLKPARFGLMGQYCLQQGTNLTHFTQQTYMKFEH